MKERLITRSGKYHGNPLNKEYHSWGKGGGGALNKVLYVLALLRDPTPYPFIYHFWQKRYLFRTPSIDKWYSFHAPILNLCNRLTAKRLCWTNVTGLLLSVLWWSPLNITVFWSFSKDLFEGRWSLAEIFFKHSYCHVCHTRCAVFFPLPFYCAWSSQFSKAREDGERRPWTRVSLIVCLFVLLLLLLFSIDLVNLRHLLYQLGACRS